MSILDTTIVTVALDTLSHAFDATLAEIQWVVTAYVLAIAAVIPVSGWAARRFGAKQVYLTSLVLFTLGSVACGLSQTTTQLILFRVLQGLGGGMIMPVGQMITAEAAGPKRMGRVLSLTAIPAALGPILGPMIGGLIIEFSSWRWIFEVNVPIGIVAFVAAVRVLPNSRPSPADQLDVLGLGLMTGGLVLLTYGLAEIGETGSITSPKVLVSGLVGAGMIAAFIVHARRARHPLLDLALYRRRTFASASFAVSCLSAAFFGSMILLPLYWQEVRHFDVLQTGILTAPQAAGMAVITPIAGRLTDRFGGGPIALVGVCLATTATIPLALIGAATPIAWLCLVMFARGAGMELGFFPTWTAALAALDRSELSHATPQLNVLMRVGGSFGTAVLAVVLQRVAAGATTPEATAAAFGVAFWVSAALTAPTVFPCMLLLRAERASRRLRSRGLDQAAPEAEPLVKTVI
jgi:EmrB/QacA subfamily drug resistance transporter